MSKDFQHISPLGDKPCLSLKKHSSGYPNTKDSFTTLVAIEGPKNTGVLIVISVKSAHHLAAMSAGEPAPTPNANSPSKNKLPSTSRPTLKSN
jgi:hypothetical protein